MTNETEEKHEILNTKWKKSWSREKKIQYLLALTGSLVADEKCIEIAKKSYKNLTRQFGEKESEERFVQRFLKTMKFLTEEEIETYKDHFVSDEDLNMAIMYHESNAYSCMTKSLKSTDFLEHVANLMMYSTHYQKG